MRMLQEVSLSYEFLVSVVVFSSSNLSEHIRRKKQKIFGFPCEKEFFVSPLPEEQCNQMISDLGAQMGFQYSEESLSRIYYETGGHPFITRQLCSVLTHNVKRWSSSWLSNSSGNSNNTVTVQVKDVEAAVSIYIKYHCNYLEHLWQQILPAARDILETIAKHDSCSLEDLITYEHTHEVRRKRRKAISELVENKIIEKCEQKYSIVMGLFERFILTIS
jgi:hypothetical protein